MILKSENRIKNQKKIYIADLVMLDEFKKKLLQVLLKCYFCLDL